MTDKDNLFYLYQKGERPKNPDDMSYIMWSDDSVDNFSNYRFAYKQAAEALYEQFINHNGDYRIKDPMGITLTFMYRHYMELTTKFLYLKFNPYISGQRLSDDEIVEFVDKTGHNLNEIWKLLKPILTELSKKLRNSFDIKAFGHYVSEFQQFDESSMKMRYPIDKKGKPFETKSQRLDIKILHDYMYECMNEVDNLVELWDNQIYWDDDKELGRVFLNQYGNAEEKVDQFLDLEVKFAESFKKRNKRNVQKYMNLTNIALEQLPEEIEVEKYLNTLSDNHLLVIHNLFYLGRNDLRKIKMWKKSSDRILQLERCAGAICRSETNKFDTPMNRGELIDTIMSKEPETVYNYIKECTDMYKNDRFCYFFK